MKKHEALLILDLVIGSTEAWLKPLKKFRTKIKNRKDQEH